MRWLPLLLISTLTACAPTWRTSYDYDASARFTGLQTYAWNLAEPLICRADDEVRNLADNTLLHDRIKAVLQHQMLIHGYRENSSGQPDFLLSYHLLTQRNRVYYPPYPYDPYYRFGYGYGRYGYYNSLAWGYGPMYAQDYFSTVLMVDVLEPASKRLIWRGTLYDAINFNQEPAAQKYTLDAAINQLLHQFPPPGIKP